MKEKEELTKTTKVFKYVIIAFVIMFLGLGTLSALNGTQKTQQYDSSYEEF